MPKEEKDFFVFKLEDQIDLYFTLIEKVKALLPPSDDIKVDDLGNAKTFERSLELFSKNNYYLKIGEGIRNAFAVYKEKNTPKVNEGLDIDTQLFWRFSRDIKFGIEFRWKAHEFQALKEFLGENQIFNRKKMGRTEFKIALCADLFNGKRFWVYIPELNSEKQIIGISKARIEFKSLVKAEIEKINPRTKKTSIYQGEYKFTSDENFLIIELGDYNHQFFFEISGIQSLNNAQGAYTNLSEQAVITLPATLSEMKGKAFKPQIYFEHELSKIPQDILKYFQVSTPQNSTEEYYSSVDIHENDIVIPATAVVLPISNSANTRKESSREAYTHLRDYIAAMQRNIRERNNSPNVAKKNSGKSLSLPTLAQFITIIGVGFYVLGVVLTVYWWPAVKLVFYRETLSNWDWVKISILAIFWGIVLGVAAITGENNKRGRLIDRYKSDPPAIKDKMKEAS